MDETVELVERESALRSLQEQLRGASAKGRIALVAGEAGIGKTSVLRALAATHGPVWWGRCDALGTPHPLAPLLDIAREMRPRFADQLAAPRPALFDAVIDELRAAPRPVLLVVEDAHWADDATLDLLKFIGRRIEGTRALLAISYRDDEVTASHPLRRVFGELPPAALTRVELGRLSPQAVESLARRAGRQASGLHERTRGNPFFVTELLRDGAGAMPSTVQDLVLSRASRLSPAAQELLHLVAIVPGHIESWLVNAVQKPLLADLETCLASGLLLAEGTDLSYRHELARVAVEMSMSPPLSQALHASVLSALTAPGREVAPARVVHHALRAADAAAISRYAPRAARQAAERGARREAAAQWRIALQHGEPSDERERTEWLEQCAIECGLVGLHQDALQARRQLEQGARQRGDLAEAALQLARQSVLLIAGMKHDEADRLNQQALQMLEPLAPGPAHTAVWRTEAFLRMLSRDCEDSVSWARRSLDLALARGDETSAELARSAFGTALLLLDYENGASALHEAVQRDLAAGRKQVAVVNLSNLGSGSGELVQLVNAERWLREALALSVANEFDNQAYYCRAWLALVALGLGKWDEAASLASEVVGKAGVAAMSRLMALLALARLRLRRGDPAAQAALDEGLALTGPHNTLQRMAPLRAARAEAAYARGDLAAVAAEVAAVLPLALAKRHAWFTGDLAYWNWRAGSTATPPDFCALPYALEITGRWREAARAWQELACPYEQARALAEGDGPAQQQALALFDRLGARPAADALRRRLREAGVRGVARGARASTRQQPCGLTAAEMRVLGLMCEDLRNAEIAVRLHRSVRTVDHHVAAVLAKLGVDSRIEAVRRAEREGWLAAASGSKAASGASAASDSSGPSPQSGQSSGAR